jgi:WS/DGAT/MGAT family acyltransferase
MARRRLSSLDGSFLRVESAVAHMHVAWKGRFRPAPGRPVTLDVLRASVAARVAGAERFRQRLAFPPGGLAEPVWVDDERFDVEHHVVALADPAVALPRARFDELCDLTLSEPLDRTRPLWRIHLAPTLDDGSVGLVMKAHHAMVDGKSAVELALLLLDLDPDAPVPDLLPWQPRPAPSGARLALEALAERSAEPLRLSFGIARTAANPARSARLAGTLRRAALAVGEDMLRPAPASYVNAPIGPRRTLVGHAVPIDQLLAVKREHEATLNDVALTVVAGALRELAHASGRVPRPLKVMVPVSVRGADEAASLGNRISFVFIELPVHLQRPLDRLAAVKRATTTFKRDGRASGGEVVLNALGMLPAPLKGPAAKLAASPRMYNLTVSNVPGPRVPVYLLGAELIEAFPVIPLPEDHALSIGMFSYRDKLCFGGYADPGALPSVAALPEALAESLDALLRDGQRLLHARVERADEEPLARRAQGADERALELRR